MPGEDESQKSKIWECGDPYQYPVPPSLGDHWEILLAPLMESDKAQCETWKDEVQNLLIFAGLFSGVLSAFVIESYQGLQPDPNDVMIALLTRIATRLDSPLNQTVSAPQSIDMLPQSLPAASSIRVNIFWFISLVLSLTTVLIGIVSLQWLREHQQYPKYLPSKQRFALFNMRAKGLEAWYVPQIFTALPVLLQSALVLFLVGLVDFLLASGTKVAIPVIVIIGIPFVFLIWTTAMPSFQAFTMCLPLSRAGRTSRVPQQCPYKSTQSRILRHIITFSPRAFLISSRSANAFHSLVILPSVRLIQYFRRNTSEPGEQKYYGDESSHKSLSEAVCEIWNQKRWLSFDEDWLALRDAYAKTVSNRDRWVFNGTITDSRQVGSLFDLTMGFLPITTAKVDSHNLFLGYHCVQDLNSSVLVDKGANQGGLNRQGYNHYLQKLLGRSVSNQPFLNQPFGTFSGLLKDPSLVLLQDENTFIFLSLLERPTRVLLQHFAELHIRILNHLYPESPRTDILDPSTPYPKYPEERWAFTYGKTSSVDEEDDPAFDANISAQFSLVLKSFFKSAANPKVKDKTIFKSLHTRKLGDSLRYAALRQSDDTIQPTLNFLTTVLERYTDGESKFGRRSDFIFYVAAFYARSLMISNTWSSHFYYPMYDRSPVLEAFLPVIRRYWQERGAPDIALGERLGVPIPSNQWWEFLNPAAPRGSSVSRSRSESLSISDTTEDQNVSPSSGVGGGGGPPEA